MKPPTYAEVEAVVKEVLAESAAYKALAYALGGVANIAGKIHSAIVSIVKSTASEIGDIARLIKGRVSATLTKVLGNAKTLVGVLLDFVDRIVDKLVRVMKVAGKTAAKIGKFGAKKAVEMGNTAEKIARKITKTGGKLIDFGEDVFDAVF
ncbi:hypothetical protein [Vannielia litorea]|uniref:hypothetical protein n=1 Tax=Vannielia litorea TaxID=1217970 RepID=UPI001BD14C85|nr:hypothetical protein [Vannielia litorea]MBS8226717.1 hypothetical protein [Vannielia litorea]